MTTQATYTESDKAAVRYSIKGREVSEVEFDQAMIALASNFIDAMALAAKYPTRSSSVRSGVSRTIGTLHYRT